MVLSIVIQRSDGNNLRGIGGMSTSMVDHAKKKSNQPIAKFTKLTAWIFILNTIILGVISSNQDPFSDLTENISKEKSQTIAHKDSESNKNEN